MHDDYISHYGVKGMKWGVRRYQNYDGTRIKSSKRPKKSVAKKIKNTYENLRGEDYKANKRQIEDRKRALKNRRNLSDEEINNRVKRLEQEKRLKNLSEEDISPARNIASRILHSTGARVFSTAALGGSVYLGYYLMTGQYDPRVAANYIFPNPNRKR